MDYERILCEVFPQIDARLIKATLLDGDDLESAVDFLVKEVLRSDGMKSDHVLGVRMDSREPSTNYINYTNPVSQLPITCSDEAIHICARTEKKLPDNCQTEGFTEVNCDKQEESIVWLGGPRTHQLLNSANAPFTDEAMSSAELHCENLLNLSSGLMQKMNPLSVNLLEEEILGFRSKPSLESNDFAHYSDKNHDSEAQDSTVLLEQNACLIPDIQGSTVLPFSEKRSWFPSFVSQQQQQASTQQLKTNEVAAGELLVDFEQQALHDGQLEDIKVTDVGLPIPENANKCNSPTALVESSGIQQEVSAPVHWERIAWEFSLGEVNASLGHLEDNPFTGSRTEPFEPVNYFDSPKSSCDQSLSADLSSFDDRAVQKTINGSSRHSVDIEDLNELVIEAKFDKEYLLKAFQEVHLLRLKTEKEEAAAQQARVEAANGGLDILVKVDETRQKLAQAQADNEVRAGEIYGEKAVLSTEARELSSRLTQAKVEQMKALNLVSEIRSTLSARLETAVQEKQSAFEGKMQKERNAQELLAIEEVLIEKVFQESKDLDAEAEACTRLRDFLIDRGSIVDSLQGEMSVLCEDVESLKKQVDEGILLSSNRSLSTSRMSHLAEEVVGSSSKSGQSSASQDLKRMAFGQVDMNLAGSTTALAGSGSSSSKSLKYFVSRTSSCFNSDDTASVHSALGFEGSEGGTTELPAEEKDTEPVDSALCTDYFSPNNSVVEMNSEGANLHDLETQKVNSALCTDYFSPNNSVVEMTSEAAILHDLETQKVNSSYVGNPGSENGHDQFGIQPDNVKNQTLVKEASNVTDEDLQGWHVEAGDDDWHMLRAQKAKGSYSMSNSSSTDLQLLDKVVWETS